MWPLISVNGKINRIAVLNSKTVGCQVFGTLGPFSLALLFGMTTMLPGPPPPTDTIITSRPCDGYRGGETVLRRAPLLSAWFTARAALRRKECA